MNLAFNSSISLWKFIVGGYLAMMSKKRVILLYDIEYEFHGVITSHRVKTQYVAQENNQDNWWKMC